jgi:hypothetical protein
MHLGSIGCSTYTNNATAAYIVRKARCPETGVHADILGPTDTIIFMLGDGGLWDVSMRNEARECKHTEDYRVTTKKG